MGDVCPSLRVTDPEGKGFVVGKNAANIEDCEPYKNIESFGQCKSLAYPPTAAATAANYGVLKTTYCNPTPLNGIKWVNGTNPKLYIRGAPVLMSDAKLNCMFGGIIEIKEEYAGDAAAATGASALTLDLDGSLFGRDHERGPGTQYINDKGQLFYRRMDGAAGRVFIVLNKDIPQLESRLRQEKNEGQLNDPDNYYLIIGLTGEQYTKTKEKYPYPDCKKAYRAGYENDRIEITRIYTQIISLRGCMDEELWNVANMVEESLNQGIEDREKGRINLYNPTARITGTPMLVF